MDTTVAATPQPLRIARHVVGMMILALASPYVWYGSQGFMTWVSTWLIPLLFAVFAFGLYYLFFTKRAKAAWPRSFFMLAWVLLALVVGGPYLEMFNNKRAAPNIATASQVRSSTTTQQQQVVPHPPIPVTMETQRATAHQTENPFRDPNYGKEIATQQQTAPPAAPVATQPPAPSAQEEHFQKIYAAHPDADAIFTSIGFQDWLSQNPKYQRVPKEGSTQEVIAMFTEFKRALATPLKKWDAATVQRNEAAAETLSRQHNPTYPR